MSSSAPPTGDFADCVERGVWTPIPADPPDSKLELKLKDVAPAVSAAIKDSQMLSFHAVGCTGCHARQQATTAVAKAMMTQRDHPDSFQGTPSAAPISFLYHLGDVVYKKDKDTFGEQLPSPLPGTHFSQLYDTQFFGPYKDYGRPIFAVAGNHDGKNTDPDGPTRKSAIDHFLKNFCGSKKQPYPYWVLKTPLAYFVGLYTNVCNAGQLDDPQQDAHPQYDWFVQTMKDIKKAADRPALFLVLHYPPYSTAANFLERGDPGKGPTPRPAGKVLEPIASTLQRAFQDAGHYPDVVLSAHAHHYQRLTYFYQDGRQIPYLIAGGGGHDPVEPLAKPCQKGQASSDKPPAPIFPSGAVPPAGDRLEFVHANDREFGFLRLTLDGKKLLLTGEYFAAFSESPSRTLPALDDTFTLDLRSHSVQNGSSSS